MVIALVVPWDYQKTVPTAILSGNGIWKDNLSLKKWKDVP
jgi:hypothetical protein